MEKWNDEMNANLKYELKAKAFQLQTSLIAPGKDTPSHLRDVGNREREMQWNNWVRTYGVCIDAMLDALDEIESYSPEEERKIDCPEHTEMSKRTTDQERLDWLQLTKTSVGYNVEAESPLPFGVHRSSDLKEQLQRWRDCAGKLRAFAILSSSRVASPKVNLDEQLGELLALYDELAKAS